MNVQDVYEILNTKFPFKLSDDYINTFGGYDNSGIILNVGKQIKKIVWTLDFSARSLDFAISENADLIITHHPAIYSKINSIKNSDVLGGKLIKAIKNNISVISMHLNCDMANFGIDNTLADMFNPNNIEILQDLGDNTGYGRVFDIKSDSLDNIKKLITKKICSEKIIAYGENKKIKRIAVFCGSGFEGEFSKFNADLIVSSDMKHHHIAESLERGIAVINATHYGIENYCFKKIFEKTKDDLKAGSVYFEDILLL